MNEPKIPVFFIILSHTKIPRLPITKLKIYNFSRFSRFSRFVVNTKGAEELDTNNWHKSLGVS